MFYLIQGINFTKLWHMSVTFIHLFTDEDIWDQTQSTNLFRIIGSNFNPC